MITSHVQPKYFTWDTRSILFIHRWQVLELIFYLIKIQSTSSQKSKSSEKVLMYVPVTMHKTFLTCGLGLCAFHQTRVRLVNAMVISRPSNFVQSFNGEVVLLDKHLCRHGLNLPFSIH